MFKKIFKTKPPDFAATNVMVAPPKSAQVSDTRFPGEVPLPEVQELDSESAWAAFSEDGASPTPAAETDSMETLQPTAFSATLPMDALPPVQQNREPFTSRYQDILNEIEQDQSQRKRTHQAP